MPSLLHLVYGASINLPHKNATAHKSQLIYPARLHLAPSSLCGQGRQLDMRRLHCLHIQLGISLVTLEEPAWLADCMTAVCLPVSVSAMFACMSNSHFIEIDKY